MAQVIWSLRALEDVAEIGMFFERDSSHYAEAIVNRLYSSVARLSEFPESGRSVPELDEDVLREMGIVLSTYLRK